MPSLLSGGKPLKGTTGSSAIFITLPTAQLSLGTTPTTGTGYTLVTGLNGQLGWTATLGKILFEDGIVKRAATNTDLIIQSNGTGTLQLNGNVLINGRDISAVIGTLTNLVAVTATVEDLFVNRSITFSSATSTATFASDVRIRQDLRVDEQFTVYGNASLNPDGGIVEIRPLGAGTVIIRPGSLGQMDNVNIGDYIPANGRFEYLTATNLTLNNFSATNAFISTGTFEKIRVLSTESDAITVAGGVTVTNALFAGEIYDSGTRVISKITTGLGLAANTNTGPTVLLTNTGVLSLTAGTDTVVSTSTGDVVVWSISTLQSVTARGNTTSVPIRITSSNSSTGPGTGALVVDGGVAVGEKFYAAAIYDNGERVISSATVVAGVGLSGGGMLRGPYSTIALTNTGVLSLAAGTDTAVSTSTGNVVVWNTSTLQTVTNRGSTTTNRIHIANGFSQVGTGTGLSGGTWSNAVFVVDGDGGFGGNLYINGDFYANGKAVLTTSTLAGSLNQGADIKITVNTTTNEITWDNISTLQSVTGRGNTTTFPVHFANTSNSTSTATGSLYASGGIGVTKDVYVGGSVYSQDGGSPAYDYKLYTPVVNVSTTTPVSARIGDFWIDPSIGVEYQYVPNGTQTVWIQFIGF